MRREAGDSAYSSGGGLEGNIYKNRRGMLAARLDCLRRKRAWQEEGIESTSLYVRIMRIREIFIGVINADVAACRPVKRRASIWRVYGASRHNSASICQHGVMAVEGI